MRSLNKLSRAKLSSSLALGTVALVSASSLVLAAGGANIFDRLDAAAMDTTAVAPPVQTIIADCTATCELWAKEGTVVVDGDLIPIWGFSTTADEPPTLPGPTIIVGSGEAVSITVHNELDGVAGDLAFDVGSIPLDDRTAAFPTIASGGTGVAGFTATAVGTSTYGAGAATPNGNRQWAMGLSGVLIVRPGECALGGDPLAIPAVPPVYQGCTYGDPQTGLVVDPDTLEVLDETNAGSPLGYDVGTDSFHDEALVALSSIDPAFAADPMLYDMTMYSPTHHLINGRLAPDTEVIDTQPGHNVLIRYANLSLADHSMGLAGAHQRMLGRDAAALAHGSDDVTVPLNVGQTVDATVAVPLDSFASYRYVLSDQVRKPGAVSADPAMTFLSVWAPQDVPGIPSGDITSIAPDPLLCDPFATDCSETAGDADLLFAGFVNTPSGATTATDARFSIDQPGADLNSTPGFPGVVATDGSIFDGVVPQAELATLVNGTHILWVQFSNDGGTTWGNPSGIAFTIDRAGPVVHPVMLEPMYTDGTTDVAMSVTADSSLTGSGLVVEGIAVLAPCPALADLMAGPIPASIPLLPFTVDPAPVVDLRGTIPAADVATYTGGIEGSYQVSVAAVDNRGVWSNDGAPDGNAESQCGVGLLIVDNTAPVTTGVSISPNPNDGTMRYPTVENFIDVVRIFATVTDPLAGIKSVEGFIDATGADGTGFKFQAVDGVFDEPSEDVYADIPLASVASLEVGLHDVWVHAQDNAGNWETFGAANAQLDRVLEVLEPDVDILFSAGTLTVNGVARVPNADIVLIEYTIGATAPAAGAGAVTVTPTAGPAITATVPGLLVADTTPPADSNIWVRVQDSEGNWSAAVGLPTTSTPTITGTRNVLSGVATAYTVGGPTAVEYSIGAAPAAAGTGTGIDFVDAAGTLNRAYSLILPILNNGIPEGPTEFTIGDTIWVRVMDFRGNWGPAVSVLVV
jgi:FtsP/CotA-like multicopper oxidase with cupredoxin domain